MQKKQVGYKLKDNGSFVIENYNFSKPFSSFFPGIAGLYGIPMWVFFVNRGQGVCSFGTNSKDQSILEFQPANKAYQMVFTRGFRTFIKIKNKNKTHFYEPFHDSLSNVCYRRENRIIIDCANLKFEEYNHTLGLSVSVDYFTVPNDNFAALARTLTLRNTSAQAKEIEIVDGLPFMIPYGVSDMFLKDLSRTIEAWMGVENLGRNAPFYRLKVDPTDRPEVIHLKKGNFFLSFHKQGTTTQRLRPIVDPECIFGTMSDVRIPYRFLQKKNFHYPSQQSLQSKTPSAFLLVKPTLKKHQSFTLYSMFGNMEHLAKLNKNLARIGRVEYIEAKRKENDRLLDGLMHSVATRSSSRTFDLYAQRTFLDNLLRGGFPISLNHTKGEVVYVYSRKHGDLERDYNKFVTQPTYFSQGNGNFRDVNQNRRNDIFFNPQIADINIKTFFNLTQLDGFNPLVVKGVCYHLDDVAAVESIVERYVAKTKQTCLRNFLLGSFYIGELFMFLEEEGVGINDKTAFIAEILTKSMHYEQAEHKEGFWVDHWTYSLDILESYLNVYPEKLKEILCDDRAFTFYDDYMVVNPRAKRYVLYDGLPKQLNSVVACEEKKQLLCERPTEPNKVRCEYGHGVIYMTSLLEKFVCIIVNKLASLDPFGVGIEMEANKPGWYDALNGLPALFGSSVCETMELKRWMLFLKNALTSMDLGENFVFSLSEELFDFYQDMHSLLKNVSGASHKDTLMFWDQSNHLKEQFREKIIFGVSGQHKQVGLGNFLLFLKHALEKIERAISASQDAKKHTYRTYFINEVVKYEHIDEGKNGTFFKPLQFRQRPLALFLEGFVHALKIADNKKERKQIYSTVRKSALFDARLGMYKVNAPLDKEPEEIGRCRVFTPGWLENESIWVHMEYKYLLELLRSGLYDEFYRDFFKLLIPFQKPQVYGRSVLENSSFIVSSAFPYKKLHGNGFVARLSGSTGEFIHTWLLMSVGEKPFFIDEYKKLCLQFRPVLAKELFTKKQSVFSIKDNKNSIIEKDCYAFNFLGSTLVVYHNPKRRNTYGKNGVSVKKIILEKAGKKTTINSATIPEEYAYGIRDGDYARIDMYLS